MSREDMLNYLKKEFGIKNEQEFLKSFAKMRKIDIGIMTTGNSEEESNDRATEVRRTHVRRK